MPSIWETLLARVREVYGDPDLHTDHVGIKRAPGLDRWRVVSGRSGVVAVGQTESEALEKALRGSDSPDALIIYQQEPGRSRLIVPKHKQEQK
jgi:hypothetical protein